MAAMAAFVAALVYMGHDALAPTLEEGNDDVA
jgi:hypothetical protein